ncbi:MAG: bifunctional molybdenum cofactor biosynthesis protein MoaC/MoaB [Pseudonocardiales bacterium]|nr:bifunctional molybdenum cofactor biosynthesis protein MoaC/MoaB [Pseudonocardiales bacterium]
MSSEVRLTHVDDHGTARMVDVSDKYACAREAVASGVVRTTEEVVRLLRDAQLPKGDALATARIAGIMAAKRTPELIPLCHSLSLTGVTVDLHTSGSEVQITATVRTTDRTGVEMEALTAVTVAGLALHDMIKAVDPAAVLDAVRVERKLGGKTGSWTRPTVIESSAQPPVVESPTQPALTRRAVVVVASNRAAAGVYADRTGPLIVEWLIQRGYQTPEPVVVPDGSPVRDAVAVAVADAVDVVLTTGGTGISPTDRTPEATEPLLDRRVPGLADAIRSAGLPGVPTAVLSRGLAGVAGRTLVVNLPGSTGGVRDGLAVLDRVLDHAIEQLHGADHVGSGTGQPTLPQHTLGPQHAPGGELSEEHSRERLRCPSDVVLRAVVTEDPLDIAEHERLVACSAAGAVVSFSGVVRDHDGGREVQALEYSSHPSAEDVINRVARQVAAAHPEVLALAVSHRVGPLAIGDSALACAVSAAHRGVAFAACAALVDEIKLQLPIWKRQEFADGSQEWVNCP